MKILTVIFLLSLLISCSQVAKKSDELKTDLDKTIYTMGYVMGSNLEKIKLSQKRMNLVKEGIVASASSKKSKVNLEVYKNNAKHALRSKVPNEDNKTYYAVGYILAQKFRKLKLNEKQVKVLSLGVENAALGESPLVSIDDYLPKVQRIHQSIFTKGISKVKAKGMQYLEDYLLSNKSAKKTPSGLVYEVLEEGSGRSPNPTDIVEVHYHGTSIDGKVFDSSIARGKKIKFPLNRVIRGWTEGLQLMKEGGKARFIIPSELAYGDNGAPPSIKGGETLVFEVELYKVNP